MLASKPSSSDIFTVSIPIDIVASPISCLVFFSFFALLSSDNLIEDIVERL